MTTNDELAGWLARVALQDRAAFEQVYRATCAHLLGIAFRILNQRERAEEVLQESFMTVWHAAGGFNPSVASPMTWLINIVRNKAIDTLRSGKTERGMTSALDDDALQVAHDLSPGRGDAVCDVEPLTIDWDRAVTFALDDDALQVAHDEGQQPEHLLNESLTRLKIDACMADLVGHERQALALAYYRGMVHTQIAQVLNAPLGTAKAWVRRGLEKLRRCLELAGVQSA